jgi:hypothetical protein
MRCGKAARSRAWDQFNGKDRAADLKDCVSGIMK